MADNTIDREIQSLLETYIPDIRDNCHECFGDGRFRHSRKEKRDAAKQGLQNLIAQEANKARLEEIEALYARADKDPVLRDKLDELYKMRYINMGGGNVFILDRLTADKEQNNG